MRMIEKEVPAVSDGTNRRGTGSVQKANTPRRFAILAVLSSAAVLALTPVAALAQETPTQRDHAREEAAQLDCSDFATQRGAQATLFTPENDRFRLDRDGDGVACETTGDGPAEDGTRLGAATAGDLDCMDFASQEAAQAHLRADPSDPDGLDPETNGVACEIRPAAYEQPATDLEPVVRARSSADLDCEDFEYQQEAQMIYFRDESDPNDLDPDGNGVPCEVLPVLASNAEDVEAGAIMDSGGPPGGPGFPTKALSAALVVSGVLALLAVSRRRNPARPG